ncbi:unnamed protein product [Symbiodinium necroappetens]|uniref:Uncharacterized protein n=1 Tax=Symbiodinium necroappetens TaxID=1628268 RepID=A0A813A2W7_9DINO|nr:unnamed protein product [Symbiodinium necroappetens]
MNQILGNIKNVAENSDVLRPIVETMTSAGNLETPSIEVLSPLILEFYGLASHPSPEQAAALAHQDAWGDARAAELVRMYEKGFAIFLKAGGNAASLKRADPDDDISDPYIQEGESDSVETPRTAESKTTTSESAEDSLESAGGFSEHFSVDDIGPRSLDNALTSVVDENEKALPLQAPAPREQMQALLDAGVAKLSQLLLFRSTEVA